MKKLGNISPYVLMIDLTNLTLGERSQNPKEYILYNSTYMQLKIYSMMFEGKLCLLLGVLGE